MLVFAFKMNIKWTLFWKVFFFFFLYTNANLCSCMIEFVACSILEQRERDPSSFVVVLISSLMVNEVGQPVPFPDENVMKTDIKALFFSWVCIEVAKKSESAVNVYGILSCAFGSLRFSFTYPSIWFEAIWLIPH